MIEQGQAKPFLSPSILSADFWHLGEDIRCVERENVPWLHVDVMDGIFVPTITYGMPVLKSIRKRTDLFLDLHLMIDRPERYVKDFAECGADLINFHLEATAHPKETIEEIRSLGKKAGITIKPETPVEALAPYLEMVDMVLVMTVEPGVGGQKLIPECIDKVRETRRMMNERGLDLDLEVDGGIYVHNVHLPLEAGANVIVSGSAIFRDDIGANIRAFQEKLNGGRSDG